MAEGILSQEQVDTFHRGCIIPSGNATDEPRRGLSTHLWPLAG